MLDYLATTKADIVMGQESHAVGEKFIKLKADARRAGWKMVGTEAQAGQGKGSSGGVFIAAKARIGLGYAPGCLTAEIIPGRLAAAHAATLTKGGLVCYSVYLWPSEGLSHRNLSVLHVMAEHAAGHGKVWMAGGDWNMEPEDLCAAGWPQLLGGFIKASTDPMGTCNKSEVGSNIDFFICDKRLKYIVEEPCIDMEVKPNPHRPLEMRVKGRAHTYMGKYRVLPKNVPTKIFIGPRREPLEGQWGEVQKAMKAAEEELEVKGTKGTEEAAAVLAEPLKHWTKVAEEELASGNDIFLHRQKYTGRNEARFAWKPVVGWRARELYQVSSRKGAAWRWVHGHIGEAIKLEWATRRMKGVINRGIGVGEDEREKHRKQVEHAARLLCKIGQKGAGMIARYGDENVWGVRWAMIADMAVGVAGGGEMDLVKLGYWAAEARALEEDEKRHREDRRKSWTIFATDAVKKGGKIAHRWLKGPLTWQPEFAGDAQEPLYGAGEICEECIELWSQVWGCAGDGSTEDAEREPSRVAKETEELLSQGDWGSMELAPIEKGMIQAAAKSFKHETAVGFCGWHPRTWQQLPDSGLSATASLLMLIEKARCWPDDLRNINLVRLQKEGGGHRLIGLLTSLYRLWGKIRRPACGDWEGDNGDRNDFATAGQSAQRAAWDFAIENEACIDSGGFIVAWQGDMEKCYELIPFSAIIQEAVALNFPSTLTYLAVYMYAGARRIVMDKVHSSSRHTTEGIIAGCPLATTLVKVCLRRLLRRLEEAYPRVIRRLFLDDLSLQWKGLRLSRKGKEWGGGILAPEDFIGALTFCIQGLVNILGARISGKSRFLANHKGLLESCMQACEDVGLQGIGAGAKISRHLGVDYSASVAVSGLRPTRRKKWVKAKGKVKKRQGN